ncbi:MAG: ATP-binding protein [Ignavibacteriaceae bacterium]
MKKAIRILLVEDNPNDAKLLSFELKRHYEITLIKVETREDFLRELKEFNPDIVLSDYNLPSFDGLEALRITMEHYPLLPFVLVTGSLNEETAVEVMKAGADDYVIKENLKRLFTSIEGAIEKKEFLAAKLKSERLLIEAEERFRTLFMNTLIGLYRTTPDGRILMANPALIKILGYDNFAELQDLNIEEDLVSESYPRELFKEEIERDGEITGFESQWLKRTGEKIATRESARVVRDEEGEILYYEGAVEDITEKKIMEEQLIEAKEKAEEMSRIKSSFFANMSHEIRTPLNSILGFSDLLIDMEAKNPDSVEMLKNIQNGGRRLLNTLDMILHVARLEQKKGEILLRETNIIPVLKETFERYIPDAQKANLGFKFIPGSEEVFCYVDSKVFANIFSQLVDNAIKYTKRGEISMTAEKEGEKVCIKVIDTGIGIPKEKKEIIWEDFRQVSEGFGRSFEGTGLGLSITKRNVELMGGIIMHNDRAGGGSEFVVNFPVSNLGRGVD